MEKKVKGAQPPGRIKVRPLMVRTPKPGVPLRVTWLADAPFGVLLHWRPKGEWGKARHFGCLLQQCPLCERHAVEWRGYLAAYDHGFNDLCMVPLTEAGYSLLKAFAYPRLDLRGLRFDITRSSPHPSSAYHFSKTFASSLSPLSPEPDLRPHLATIYPEIAHVIWDQVEEAKGGES